MNALVPVPGSQSERLLRGTQEVQEEEEEKVFLVCVLFEHIHGVHMPRTSLKVR